MLHGSDQIELSAQELARLGKNVDGILNNFPSVLNSLYDTQKFPEELKKFKENMPSGYYPLSNCIKEMMRAHMWYEIATLKTWQKTISERRYFKNYNCNFKSLTFAMTCFLIADYLYKNTDLSLQPYERLNTEILKFVCIPVFFGLGSLALHDGFRPSDKMVKRITALNKNYSLLSHSPESLYKQVRDQKFNGEQ